MKTIGIIGAGTMGSGIAYLVASAGCAVLLNDVSEERLHNAIELIQGMLAKAVESNRLPPSRSEEVLLRIRPCASISELSPSNIVVEAAVEEISVKKDIFRQLDSVCSNDAILASNTSSLSITEIASVVSQPERVAGMHFFNPAQFMKLVEVIRGRLTSEQTVSTVVELTQSLGKVPVVVKDTPGFIVNRVARPFYLEALRLLGEGVTAVEEIDRIVRLEGGFKMGPFELMDLIGVDVNYAVTKSVYEQFFHEPRFRPHPIQQTMVQSGMLGRKTGKGFYEYSE